MKKIEINHRNIKDVIKEVKQLIEMGEDTAQVDLRELWFVLKDSEYWNRGF